MNKSKSIILFKQKQIRRSWNEKKELWYFSVVDVIETLTDSPRPRKYWNALKTKLNGEGSELSQKVGQLKLESYDGKKYLTDVADTETILRLVQSIPSPKAEPFKIWLAKVDYERIEETEDPELAIGRAMKTYLRKGYSKEWINQRLKSIEIRKELTDEWQTRGMKEGLEYAILTDEITKAWSEKSVKNYKKFKGLKKENPKGLKENKSIARKGGFVAKKARVEIEKQTKESIVSPKNAKHLKIKKAKFILDKNN